MQTHSIWVRLVSLTLLFQLAFGSTAMVMAAEEGDGKRPLTQEVSTLADKMTSEGLKDPEVIATQKSLERALTELDKAGPTDLPSKTPDGLNLASQALIYKGKRFGLTELDLPSIVPDFEREVTVEIVPETSALSFTFKKNGETVAQHLFEGHKFIGYARDAELLQFVDSEGKIYALDMEYARLAAFKEGGVPYVHVATLPREVLEAAGGNLKFAFATRGFKPFSGLLPHAVVPNERLNEDGSFKSDQEWEAGEFLAYVQRPDGKFDLAGAYNRSVTDLQLYTFTGQVAYAAAMVSSPDTLKRLSQATELLNDPSVASGAEALRTNLSSEERDALSAIPTEQVARLRNRMSTIQGRGTRPVDRYTFEEWGQWWDEAAKHWETDKQAPVDQEQLAREWQKIATGMKDARLAQMAKEQREAKYAQIADFADRWVPGIGPKALESQMGLYNASQQFKKTAFYRVMTSSAMRVLAKVALGIGAYNEVASLIDGNGPVWAVHFVNIMLQHGVIPEVLKNAVYRDALLKSSICLASPVAALWALGSLYGKKVGWPFKKVLATAGVRIYAAVSLPFHAGLARLLGQQNLITALSLGQSPLSRVAADSALGKALGLTRSVFPALSFGEKDAELKKRVLKAKVEQRNRVRAYSMVLASLPVAEKFGIDPAFFLMVSRGEVAPSSAITDLMRDPEFLSEWVKVSRELFYTIKDLRGKEVLPDLDEIDSKQFAQDFELAKQTAENIRSRSALATAGRELSIFWRESVRRFGIFLGTFGQEQFKFLRDVEVDKQIYELNWRQYTYDYLLSIGFVGFYGPRANLNEPRALAADPNAFMWTNPQHVGDMGDQDIVYGITAPARSVQVFQRERVRTEGNYDPLDKFSLARMARPENFVLGAARFAKNAANLRKANYPSYFMRRLNRVAKTLQPALIMEMICRVGLAGQPVHQALSAYVYMTIWANWAFGWYWDPATIGIMNSEAETAESNAQLEEAQALISQADRRGDEAQLAEGYERLSGIFAREFNGTLNSQMRKDLAAAESLLGIPPGERLKAIEKLKDLYGPAARLSLAIHSSKPQAEKRVEIEQAYRDLLAQYDDDTASELKALNARSLLEYSLRHPPIVTEMNESVKDGVTATTSLLTTYLGTFLFVDSYRPSSLTFGALAHVTAVSASIYASTYYGQKLIELLGTRMDFIRAYDKAAMAMRNGTYKAPAVAKRYSSFEAFKEAFLEKRAAQFRVDRKLVEDTLDDSGLAVLQRQYEAYRKSEGSISVIGTPGDAVLADARARVAELQGDAIGTDCEKALVEQQIRKMSLKDKARTLLLGPTR